MVLHAVTHRKASAFLTKGQGRRPIEDIVTSSIFGPLELLPPQDIFSALFLALGLPTLPWTPAFCEFNFWPRKSVEPDLMVSFKGAAGDRLTLLVEVKWNSRLGTDQGLRQWREFGDPFTWHVFVVREQLAVDDHLEEAGMKALSEGETPAWLADWRSRQVVASWRQVGERLRQARSGDLPPGLARWAAIVPEFLSRLGERNFGGFASVVAGRALGEIPEHLFWPARFAWPDVPLPETPECCFWLERRSAP